MEEVAQPILLICLNYLFCKHITKAKAIFDSTKPTLVSIKATNKVIIAAKAYGCESSSNSPKLAFRRNEDSCVSLASFAAFLMLDLN